MRVVVGVGVAVLALAAAVARPAPATAATPCWKALLNDWYDGRIDNTYPLHCYSEALTHLPADVQTYSSAHDDILRALQNAKAELRRNGTKVTPNTPVPPAGKPGKSGGGKTTSTGTTTTTRRARAAASRRRSAERRRQGQPLRPLVGAAAPDRAGSPRTAACRGGRSRASRKAPPGPLNRSLSHISGR